MSTKFIQYLLFILGFAGFVAMGWLLNEVAPGSGFLFWIVIGLIFLYGMRRYPKEEVAAIFGLLFGVLGIFGIGGTYYWASSGYEFLAIIWLVLWLTGFIVFQRRIQKWLTPTFFLADEFARIVGPIPLKRELPRGCFLVGFEMLFFFVLLMVAGLLGPILWLIHLGLLYAYRKIHRGKRTTGVRIALFIIFNLIFLMVLYQLMEEMGFESFLRKILGG